MSFAGDGATGAIEEKASTGGAKGSVKNSQSVVPPGEPNSKDDNEKNHLHFEVTGNQHMKLISGAALKAKRTRQQSVHHQPDDPYTAELKESLRVHKTASGKKKAKKSSRREQKDEETMNAMRGGVEMASL